MGFVADGIGVGSRSGDQKIQRLHSGITGALGHYVKKLSVRLSMKLIKDHTVNVKAVLGISLSG